jgi:hypothetical protein
MSEDNQESLEELKKISFKLEKLEKTNGTIKVLLTSIGIGMFSFALVFGLTSSIKAAVWTFVLGVVATETESVLKKR